MPKGGVVVEWDKVFTWKDLSAPGRLAPPCASRLRAGRHTHADRTAPASGGGAQARGPPKISARAKRRCTRGAPMPRRPCSTSRTTSLCTQRPCASTRALTEGASGLPGGGVGRARGQAYCGCLQSLTALCPSRLRRKEAGRGESGCAAGMSSEETRTALRRCTPSVPARLRARKRLWWHTRNDAASLS